MALRKASSYSKRTVVAYTRISKKKSKSYIKTVPPQKIVKFSMGNQNLYDGKKLPLLLTMVSEENVQIRHNALESCRQFLNKVLDNNCAGAYFFKVVPFPHHIQRENKMLTGAGADRMQTGMQLSFGRAVGKAAILKPGSKIFYVAVSTPKAVSVVRKAFQQLRSKMPGRTRVVYEEIK
ncbi:MAG TPA: 50S ribosomal protein L16 [Candidatus Nanoarchaeia archaeon]|nr:50S ribosomal protein L16 [Candidatus Nanoarchaeia archaeon]